MAKLISSLLCFALLGLTMPFSKANAYHTELLRPLAPLEPLEPAELPVKLNKQSTTPPQTQQSSPIKRLKSPKHTKRSGKSAIKNFSPAQQLFNSVNEIIFNNYGGLSKINLPELREEFQQQLNLVCQNTPNTCQTAKAYPIIDAELTKLADPHSYFQTPEDFQNLMLNISGGNRQQFGVKLAYLDGENRIVLEVLSDSAAAKAGLQRGDVLTSINNQPYAYSNFRQASYSQQKITLGIERQGKTLNLEITPTKSSIRDLPRLTLSSDSAKVGILRIPTFLSAGGVASEVHRLVAQAQAQGLQGLVVDLRGNTGGSLAECNNSITAFVPQFQRVAVFNSERQITTFGQEPKQDTGYHYRVSAALQASLPTKPWNGPLVVLVDKDSASCSELFAFEVQHARRGIVVGEPTAGVGNTATRIFPIGNNTALHLTITSYLKPNGTPYPSHITPDLALLQGEAELRRLASGKDVLLDAGIAALSQLQVVKPPNNKTHTSKAHSKDSVIDTAAISNIGEIASSATMGKNTNTITPVLTAPVTPQLPNSLSTQSRVEVGKNTKSRDHKQFTQFNEIQ